MCIEWNESVDKFREETRIKYKGLIRAPVESYLEYKNH